MDEIRKIVEECLGKKYCRKMRSGRTYTCIDKDIIEKRKIDRMIQKLEKILLEKE